jgi:Tape measure protein
MLTNDINYIIRLQDQVSPKIQQAEGHVKNFESSLGGLSEKLKEVAINIGAAFAVEKIFEFGKELVNLTAEFQGFENVIKFSSDGIVDSATNINFLNNEIIKLHLPMQTAYEGFSELQAGLIGTGIEGDRLRKVFEGLSTAATVLHMPQKNYEMILYDFKELAERGMNQKNYQSLSGWLPGVNEIIKEHFHKNFHQLHEEGKLSGAQFIEGLAEGLQKHFEGGLGNAGKSLMSELNDEKNSITKLMLDMGTSLEPLFIDILHTIKSGMEGLKGLWDGLTGNSDFVKTLKTIFDWGAKLIPIFIGYKAVMMATSLVTSVFAVKNGILTLSMGSLTMMTDGSTVAFEGFSAALASTGIGAFVVSVGLLIENIISLNKELDEAIDKKFKLDSSKRDFSQIDEMVSSVKERQRIFDKLSISDKQSLAKDVFDIKKLINEKEAVLKLRGNDLDSTAKKTKKLPFLVQAAAFAGIGFNPTMVLSSNEQFKKINEENEKFKNNLKGFNAGKSALDNVSEFLNKKGIKYKGKEKELPGTEGSDLGNKTSKVTGARTTTFNIKIDKLAEITISTTHIKEAYGQIKDHVTNALLAATNDFQLATDF